MKGLTSRLAWDLRVFISAPSGAQNSDTGLARFMRQATALSSMVRAYLTGNS